MLRSSLLKRCNALLAGAALAAGAGRAAAQTPSTLTYDAPPACPSRSVWMDRVLARLADEGRSWTVERLEAVPAQVTVGAAGTEARILFRDGDMARLIRGADCDEVTSAAALIVAVALGRSAEKRDEPAPVRAREAAPGPGIDQSGRAPALERDFGVALGANAELNDWSGPGPMPLLGVSVDMTSPSRAWSARFTGVYGTSDRNVGARRAEFEYWGGHLDLCPLVLGTTDTWRWSGCAELHLGLLTARGDERSALASGLTRRALLATGAASTRLETPPLWAIVVGVEAGLAVPVLRQTFQFEAPAREIFESPAVGLVGRVGIRVPIEGRGE